MVIRSNIKLLFTAYFLLLNAYSFSQEYRNSGFVKPMNLPFNLAGSFGEPRPDHFHSGIDIKTNGVEGQPVFAIGDGYISRIRVSPYGYGKAIYITHTNGFTSVYGHLSTFYGAIEKYIHAQHYAQKKSELDLTLDATIFPVKQNDMIAFSGNTGGSTAPHLHFEIRNTKTEHALNPLDFYPKEFYVDTIPPNIDAVFICGYNTSFYNNSSCIVKYRIPDTIYKNLLFIDAEQDNFFIKVDGFDKQDSSTSKNGIYKITLHNNTNKIWFEYTINEIDFDKTRMCNAFVDYYAMTHNIGYYYNCFKFPKNTLTIFNNVVNNGVLNLDDILNDTIYIDCFDYNFNKTTIKIKFIKTEKRNKFDRFYPEDTLSLNNTAPELFNIQLDESMFYDNVKLHVNYIKKEKSDLSDKAVIDVLRRIPLHKPAKIEFKSSVKKNKNKIVIVRQDDKGKETALKTTFDKAKFYAETKELGTFYLKHDTTKPAVEILNLNSEFITIKIADNLSGINTYNGYVDNKWVNFYYDAKNDLLQYHFDEYCTKGEHILKVIVTDKVGNKNIVQHKFIH